MDDTLLRILGVLVIAGFIIGIAVPAHLLFTNNPGNATLPYKEFIKLFNMYRGKGFKEVEEKTINITGWERIYLDLTIISGYLKITTSNDIKDKIIIKILSADKTASTDSYNIYIDKTKEKIEIISRNHDIGLDILVPKNKTLIINSVIKSGASNIEIDGETLSKLELSIMDGLALVKMNNLGLSKVVIRNFDSATFAELSYKYFIGRSWLIYECMGGILNAKTYVDQKTKLEIGSYEQNGYTHIFFNGKPLNYYYSDLDYDIAESILNIGVRTYEGYVNVGIER